MDWLEFFGRYGLPTIILAAIAIFFSRSIWPFIVKAWETQQDERREERQEYLKALEQERQIRMDERDKFLTTLDEYRRQLELITKALESMNGVSKGGTH